MGKNDLLKDIVWGNKIFVNAQFVIGLVNRISKFFDGELRIESVFDYVNAIKKQKRIEIYKDLINFVLDSTITIFTSKITRKG